MYFIVHSRNESRGNVDIHLLFYRIDNTTNAKKYCNRGVNGRKLFGRKDKTLAMFVDPQ
jgi:hypothetical protein